MIYEWEGCVESEAFSAAFFMYMVTENKFKGGIVMLKKIIALMGAAVFTAASLNTVFAENTISVKINGKNVEFDQPPTVENGRTLIPFRAVLEEMGLYVDWNSDTKTIICTDGYKTGLLTIGSSEMIIGDSEQETIFERISLDVPAKIVNGRTLVPIRAVAESFGAEVTWDENTKTVEINAEKEELYTEKLEEAGNELGVLIFTITQNIDELDAETTEKFMNIGDDMLEYADTVKELAYTQENIDKVTEQFEIYIRQLKDLAEGAGITEESYYKY